MVCSGFVRRRLAVFLLPLFLAVSASSQPNESGKHFRQPDLVELVRLDSTITLDIRYATVHNFTKRKMYSQARAFLQRPAARALVRVNARLRSLGYGVVILDAYRPWSVTKKFWDETPPEKRDYVANPKEGSRHNRGGAVDVTLRNLSTGKLVEMPSDYDDFSKRASPDYLGGTPEQRRVRDLLRHAMVTEGFSVSQNEWWHFNYKDSQEYQILDIPFEALK